MAENSSPDKKPCRHKAGEKWEPGCCGDDAIAAQQPTPETEEDQPAVQEVQPVKA